MLIFNNLQQMNSFYNKETNAYFFEEDIKLNFNLQVDSNICAWNINALNINAWNIIALDINAENVNASDIFARDVSYWAVCVAERSFRCKSVKGRRKNSIHKCLDQEIEFVKD